MSIEQDKVATHRKLIRVMESFRSLDPHMSLTEALALLYAAEEEVQRDVERRLGTSNASASRSVSFWEPFKIKKEPGQGMITKVLDPMDQRYRLLKVNAKGQAFLDQLHRIIDGE